MKNIQLETLLKSYLDECETLLTHKNNRKYINYDFENIEEWYNNKNDYGKDLKILNSNALPKNDANIYAIFIDNILVYIGQTKSSLNSTRLTNHLFYKHPKTGSKLDKIKLCVKNNNSISTSYIAVKPESLRHYIEDELITKYTPEWNIQGK
ncbi:MAG TPA: hypothetical protein EYG82_05200 [Sulfurovum sp.]|nr:hypothetical protein [Sulfurovum sp.]